MGTNISLSKDVLLPLLTQFVSVLVGALLAFWIARWQMSMQDREVNEKGKAYAEELFSRMKLELRDNKDLITQHFSEAVNLSGNSYDEHWYYLDVIVCGFRFDFYRALITQGLFKDLPKEVQEATYICYDYIRKLQLTVFRGRSHQAYCKAINSVAESKQLLKDVQTYTRTVVEELERNYNIVIGE
jgi:hypothetical protein